MKINLLFAAALLFPLAAIAQPAAPPAAQPVHCAFQPQLSATPADLALASGDFAHAEALYTAQLDSQPLLTSFAGAVKSQLANNRLAQAQATAQRAAARFPGSAEALALLGDTHRRAGEIPEASDAYRKALALDPCSPRAHFGYGELAELSSRHTMALQHVLMAHRLSPSTPEYTAGAIDLLPLAERQAPLKQLLEHDSLLPPSSREDLQNRLSLLEQGALCTPEHPYTDAKLPLQPLLFQGKFTRSWGLKVRTGPKSSPLLELDSSVSGIVLTPEDAARAGVQTIGSPQPGQPSTGIIAELQISGLKFLRCPVRIDPALDVSSSNSLIGIDFFRDHLIHIDYVAETLTLSPLPPFPQDAAGKDHDGFVAAEEKDWSAVYIAHGEVLVPTLINRKGPYLFALDTGIGSTVTSPAITAALLGASRDATVNLKGVSGEIVKVLPREGGDNTDQTDVYDAHHRLLTVERPVKFPVFRFTRNEIASPGVVSFSLAPLSQADGVEVSGLFGFDLLDQFSIDINFRDGLARILFDQNRRYAVRQQEKAF